MKKDKLSSIKQISIWLWHTWKGYRLQAFLNTLIGMILVFSDLAFVWATKLSIDIATHVEKNVELSTALSILVGIMVTQILLGITSRWIRALLGVDAQNKMQRAVFARLLMSEWQGMKRFHTGNLLNRIERDVADVIDFLTEYIPSLTNTCVQFIGAFLFLFWMDSTLACVVVVVLPFFIIVSKLYMKKMRKLTHDVRDTESKIQSVIQESLQHTLVIKTLERTQATIEKLGLSQKKLHGEVITKTKYSTVSSTLINIGFATGYLITFIWGVTSLEQGLITYGAMLAFIQLVGKIQGPVRAMTQYIPIFIGSFTASERLMELEEIPLEPENENKKLKEAAGIKIENLTFAYDSDSRKIFDHFDFDFPPQSVTAILGETGSGKTTLIRVLLSLINPSSGNVYLYDKKGNKLNIAPCTRSNFSYVPQGNTLLSGTIRENLLLGDPNATEEEMKEALRCAAADFVFNLPNGLESVCGEMGDGLSEGQAQRISIARAILKNSPVLLLDEATSALDEDTEKFVIQNIIERYNDRTLIFITHRPEVLKYCSQTLKLNKKTKS